jgi:hypothetical protein
MLSKLKSKITQVAVATGGSTIIQSARDTVVNRFEGAVDAITETASTSYTEAAQRLTHPRAAYDRAVAELLGELDYITATAEGPLEVTPGLIRHLRDSSARKNPY